MKVYASLSVTSNTIKLREHPKASSTKRYLKKYRGQGNDLGYGKNDEDVQWAICSQVLNRFIGTDAVHRLNGGGWK